MEYDPLPESDSSSAEPSASSPSPSEGVGSDRPGSGKSTTNDDIARAVRRRRFKRLVVYPLLVALLAALTGVVVAASIRRPQVESLDDFVPRLVTQLFDRHHQVVNTYSRENRVLLEESEVPELLKNAILAVEDANFYQHGGIDLKGIVRAMVKNIRERRFAEGASTITMQLSRELFALTRERDFQRKIEEAFLSVELEKKYSKQQILTLYCNMVNMSNGNYGMEAAARNYFDKSVQELSLAEAATLAGIPQRPSDHNPFTRPDTVTARRNVVLARMLDEEFITREEYEAASAEPLLVVERRRQREIGPYFTEEVRRHLISTYGQTELYDRGLQVYTTLDKDIQRAVERAVETELLRLDQTRGWRGVKHHLELEGLAEKELPSWPNGPPLPGERYEGIVLESGPKVAVVNIAGQRFQLNPEGFSWTRRKRPDQLLKPGDVAWFRLDMAGDGSETPLLHLEQEPEVEAAAVVIESATGAVRGMVGGWSYQRNEFNRITQARRQVGSAFKPFVFGAALEIGFTAADTLFDGPVTFPGADNEDSYSPRNFYRSYNGILTLREALERSINVPAVKLLDIVGVERVIDFARRAGIESELPPYPSLALGAADLTPIELAAAYAAIANQGVYVEPYLIEKVTSQRGRLMEEHLPQAHKAMTPTVAYVLLSMLRGVATRGTAARLSELEIPTAGKTGTTNSFTDAWFVGFTPNYTVLTWVGYDKKRFLGRGWTGAHAALPIWRGIIQRGLEDGWLKADETFDVPPGIVVRDIEPHTGLLFGPGAERIIPEVFVEGTEPEKRFNRDWARIIRLPWYLQEPSYIPKEGERMPAQVDDWAPIVEGWKDKS